MKNIEIKSSNRLFLSFTINNKLNKKFNIKHCEILIRSLINKNFKKMKSKNKIISYFILENFQQKNKKKYIFYVEFYFDITPKFLKYLNLTGDLFVNNNIFGIYQFNTYEKNKKNIKDIIVLKDVVIESELVYYNWEIFILDFK